MNKNKTVTPGYATSVNLSKARSGHSPLLQSLRSVMLRSCVLFPLFVLPLDVNAVAVTSLTQIGDTITNPVTNVDVTVLERILDPNDATGLQAAYVITSDGKTLLAKTQVGDTLGVDNGTSIDVYDILAVNVNGTSGFVDSVDMRLNTLPVTDPVVTQTVVSTTTASFGVPTGSQGAAGAGEVIPPTTTSGVIDWRYKGANGSNGNDGYGVRVCDPLFGLGCTTIGYSGSAGANGAAGPAVGTNIYSSHGLITSTASNVPGIRIGSTGGDGGQGGDAYGNFAAKSGGDGGAGGNVAVANHTDVNVGGTNSYGMYVFSRSGDAGAGGTGYLFGVGGNGGAARDGGTVNVTNDGTITTSGQGAHGIYGLSVGGSAGNGGGSWGIVGSGGNGADGGNGGAVNITNNGIIHTTGKSAHGILAQSVGGTGGNGGSAGGIVAFGGDASQGGVGRNVRVTNQANADITTEGNFSVGVLGQSIGGSGGDSGAAGGIVALGASGGSGNNAGTVTINNLAGSQITTLGKGAYGVLAQSIGGGGGNSLATGGLVSVGGSGSGGGNGNSVTINSAANIDTAGAYAHGLFGQSIGGGGGSAGGGGGLVALGGSGGAAGNGGVVQITNSGTILTTGIDARGIFGQSIGGGGGSGGATGGLVALGGAGSSGGYGRAVYGTNAAGARIDTLANGADAIFIQSIGGGGGSGASSGGLVALGGAASGAGNGGFVRATNNGILTTKGDLARGIFVQSIGGGGGSGGIGGGLVAIAGSGGAASTGGNVEVNTGVDSNISTTGQYSTGIFSQSIGGGGGVGGSSGGLVAIGGSGGGGGNAGTISLNTGGNVTTIGNDSTAIFAQSIGGGGGNSLASGGVVSIGGGGSSGGGNGNTVSVTSSAILNTVGNNSHGIQAQSVGGGGGNAGPTGGLVSIGGTGGGGGLGRQVSVANSGSIHTQGLDSRGIFIQSIGGGGGSGGVSGGLVSLGGSGAGAGNAGNVTITNAVGADIWTEAKGSDAIFAQSIGGGGGSGATSGGLVSLGGKGSSGGIGGIVSISNDAVLWTDGDWARGIFGQSIGGGGGSGGDSGGLVSIGGSSGVASNANNVLITSNGDIRTLGDNSTAVYAQSVGGGGGNGGSSGGAISIGGAGNGGGNGGEVIVATTGVINTTGDKSSGIFAQSVGGGGGDGATSGGIVTIGGSAGPGSNGGVVSATHGGVIHTRGEDAFGIFAQSVGGGGGNGGGSYSGGLFAGFSLGGDGNSGGLGGAVNVDLNTYLQRGSQVASLIQTENDRSIGILAQSVGGGGGNGGNAIQATVGIGVSLSLAIGGNAGAGGEGGTVDLAGIGDVLTLGNNAGGVVLQSVGGGGGNGGMSVSSSASIGDGVAIGVAIGGEGGSGGKGGIVSADVESNIETQGESSTGFLAQSVGGGGGNGGTSIAATAAGGAIGAAAISVGVGGSGGLGGSGDHVDVTLAGSVLTLNDQSDGVVIQSVGGGGGNGGLTVAAGASGAGVGAANVTASVGGSGGGGGIAGRVDANISSDVETQGDGSDGVIIQSIGGGGGNAGLTISAGLSGAGVVAGGINVGIGGSGGGGGNGDIVVAGYNGTLVTRGDNATGLLAQSVGGGGGNSSGAIAASLNGAGEGAGSISVGIGGSGGIAGDGGKAGIATAVTINVAGFVTTLGNNSSAIIAQSVGGGGGNGGYSISGALAGGDIGSGAISVGIGGSAGSGGNGKGVDATLAADILTLGDDSLGALIQSVGGGGGNGGFNVSGSASGAGIGSAGIAVGLGGDGGLGGLGGNINASSSGVIVTQGARSSAFVAQSIGGGGGNGGFNVAGSLSGGGIVAGAISVGLGGNAGAGNHAGIVNASTSGDISTYEKQSLGVLAQSIGGGGGNGGFNVAAGGSGGGEGSAAISVGLGGSGGGAGDGGQVSLDVTNNVYTGEDQSAAVIAQSVGGGGGNGSFNVSAQGSGAGIGSGVIGFGLGGNGASGGNADKVTASVTGNITTVGNESGGILAQSVGGGGGNGGLNVTGSLAGGGIGAGGISVSVGGSGSIGGSGDDVLLATNGNVNTSGDQSRGIVAQSIGGGGGNGGLSVDAFVAGAGEGSGAIAVSVGGSGGNGGISGRVDAVVAGDINTQGDFSDGLLIQSIGGGGGNAALNVAAGLSGGGIVSGAVSISVGASGGIGGDANLATADYNGLLTTNGDHATGMLVQAIGGGGGNGGGSIAAGGAVGGVGSGVVSIGIGGSGGASGDGGLAGVANAVTATAQGQIVTNGDYSSAFVAQSIGGGGGNGGYNVSANMAGAGEGSGAVGVGIGGSGSGGGQGKGVDTNVSSNISTYGNDSVGMLSQSIGGGGGNGGFSVSAIGAGAGVGSAGVSVSLGGSGATGGLSGLVNAIASGSIYTEGDNSAAFIAQSIGGGGGNGGFNVAAAGTVAGTGSGVVGVGLGGSGDAGGNGGAVIASTSGQVVTIGDSSTGILAQSVGGGGGNGGFNVLVAGSGAGTGSAAVGVGLGGTGAGGGDASTVDLTVANNVTTEGNDSAAIVAQSVGGGGGNGGFNVSVAGSGAGTGSGAVSVGLGGSAGLGGNASDVISSVIGDILTGGENSTGLLVQSVGGGGGNGGFNVSVSITGAGTGAANAAVGIGGSGGGGGISGVVTSVYTGDVRTTGKAATGVIAQSVGGGGGNGGLNVSGSISAAKTGSAGVAVGIGGSGGAGGNSNVVDNTVIGEIVTTGESGSGGVLAQSVGGGGGNGGINVSGAIALSANGAGAVSVGLGGSGGDGGDAGLVTNAVTGNVFTDSEDGFGVVAQSIGGGGGNGGINVSGSIAIAKTGAGGVGIGLGGSGGGGGNAALVNNTVTGYVQTLKDNSVGILAQSVGGGGGNGGLNISATITAAKTGSGGIAVGLGGFGGSGGNGADVFNNVIGGTITTGDNSGAIVAQSLGGGGGNGAVNVTSSINLSKDNGGVLGVGLGGFGGDGGNAANVTSIIATTSAFNQIGTTGDNSSAVVAQSIGGSGGNGALNVTGTVNLTGKNGAAIGVGVGGFGGGAGDAGNVNLGVTGQVVTEGVNSHGLVAQSIGGGGGNGGTNITGSLAITKANGGASATAVAAAIGVGGFGGNGGVAGNVDVAYTGTIEAQPRVLIAETTDPVTGAIIPAHYEFNEAGGSHGILAQSLGGGGGNGGVNISAGISYGAGEGDGHALLVGVGGFGGTGGDAGLVDVNVSGGESISSYGAGHSAILAQSTGGGGGNGAVNVSGGIVSDSPLIVGVGGLGGNAGIGSDVTVNASTDVYASAIDSKDLNSAGILAQSIGGGGGNGGLNVSGGISLGKEANVPSITVGVGGFGGAGAISGDVSVDHTGQAITSGNWIHGIMAQSIAGGGGNGALNVSGQLNWADSANSGGAKDLSIVAGIGGHGGLGANAGDVAVTSTGRIVTAGDFARGIFAQTIGGGGGNGGMNVTGVFAKNSSPVSVGIGGFGSGGGDAGAVSVTRGNAIDSAGKISTNGTGAIGIEASSIGGGGGDAGMNFILGISLAGGEGESASGSGGASSRSHPQNTGVDSSVFTNFDAVLNQLEGNSSEDAGSSTDANKSSPYAVQIAIGGAGGEAGHGGTARVDHFGDIETIQDSSHGIMAQSIGGGGGNATLNLAVTYQGKSDKSKGLNVAVGGQPGDGGNGAAVDVTHDGFIETHGANSYGVLSQSIGGGGGNVGLDLAYSKTGGKLGLTLGRHGGTGGIGGDVTLFSKGSVITHGNTSYGLLAQSIGNGGGNSSSNSVSVGLPENDGAPARAASVAVGLEGGVGGAAGNVTLGAEGWISTDGENAHAIFAQSVGGGGGNGGSATGVVFLASTAALTIGGTGGQGGVGGDIDVTSSAEVRTQNSGSVGILAQSVGGGGGSGGMARAGGLSSKGSGVLVTVGGGGGVGMSSGLVTVDNSGVIITDGLNSHGVLAQSLGGGGGNAGMTINSVSNSDPDKATQISVSVGGNGGEGAISSDVIVTNTGGIGTNQDNSIGIFAQSIAGGGGNANSVITSSLAGAGAGNNISIGVGGTGGVGAAAANVSVSNLTTADVNSGEIITLGNFSHGIMAMSVGGGGGVGSTTITANRQSGSVANSSSKQLAFSMGGAGGVGGTGGNVDVLNAGSITTYGYKAHGIVAQSVGGGGGQGGMSIAGDLTLGATSSQAPSRKSSTISIGGFGGDGNTAGDVIVTNSGSIEVFGNKSYGIYAQSVGGGGGDGGFSTNLSANLITNPRTDLLGTLLNFGLGGNGGDGADAGNVLVEHTGSIISQGDDSYGIFAQSIGGGGGNAGYSISSPIWMAADMVISSIIGGRDGSQGLAGTVTVNTTGDIVMLGENSQAQFTQTVNGGGGNAELFLDVSQQAGELGEGGFILPDNGGIIEKITAIVEIGTTAVTGAIGSAIDATHVGDLYTFGERSIASLTQSIGGGGGNSDNEIIVASDAEVDLVLALGGSESSNSGGGNVDQSREGDASTTGDQSQGVGVQSIGGGGGNLNVNVRTVPAPVTAPVVAAKQLLALPVLPAITATVQLGSDLSDNNDGGDINLAYSGDLSTAGDMSAGLNIQSIGGGGGQVNLLGLDVLDISIGASGGSTGNGGNITMSNTGAVFTEGGLSHGVIIQSIGGGGGSAFTDMNESAIALSFNTDNSGNGGNIDFVQTGNVVVTGDRSIGILAQSLGGGGGVVDRLFADTAGGAGISGAINITLNDSVAALGLDGAGVFAQSRGADGQGDITLTLSEANLIAAGENGVGVWISGGTNNSFTNYGGVTTLDGINGWAVIGEEGNDVIDNFGTLEGQVDLGSGVNTIFNHSSDFFLPGEKILLGNATSQLINDGIMVPGDTQLAQHVDMTGSFVQSGTGVTFSELDFGSDVIDQIAMTGSADLDGELVLSLLNPELVPIGHFQKDLFAADLGVTDNGLIMTTAPSVVIAYELIYPTANAAVVDYNIDFAPTALSNNLQGLGNYINRIQIAGSSPELADTITQLLYTPTIEGYSESLSQLTPDFYGEHQARAIRGSQQFAQLMADQGEGGFGQDPASGADYRFTENDKLFWFQMDGENNTHEAYGDYKTVNHYTQRFGMGIHQELDESWSYGLGISYEDNQSDGYDGRWVASGNTQHLGVELKHQSGSSQVALIQTYSWSQADVERVGQLTDAFHTKVNRELETYGGILRISDVVDEGSIYVRSAIDLGVTHLMAEAATESGAGATNLDLKSYSETHSWIKPAVRLGYKHMLASRTKVNLFAGIGLHHYFGSAETDVLAGFEGAPDGVAAMQVPVDLSKSYLEGVVGVNILSVDKVSLGLQYNTILDKHSDLNHFSLNLSIPF